MENRKKNRNAVLGIVILVIGTLLLLDNFDQLNFPIKQYIFSWKTLLLIVGVYVLAVKQKLEGGIVLISLGLVMWIPAITGYRISLDQIFLPAVFMIVGVVVLVHRSSSRRKMKAGGDKSKDDDADIVQVELVEER